MGTLPQGKVEIGLGASKQRIPDKLSLQLKDLLVKRYFNETLLNSAKHDTAQWRLLIVFSPFNPYDGSFLSQLYKLLSMVEASFLIMWHSNMRIISANNHKINN